MRAVRNLRDAEIVIRQHDDFIDSFKIKDLQLNNRKINNLGAAQVGTDAVNLDQVENLLAVGFSGSIKYIKTVDFVGSKVTMGFIVVKNGKIMEIN
jgi:hypothetical protein